MRYGSKKTKPRIGVKKAAQNQLKTSEKKAVDKALETAMGLILNLKNEDS